MCDYDDDSDEVEFAHIPPSGTIVARTRDVEVADELLYFAMRNDLRLEYSEQPDRVIAVGVHPDDAQAVRDYMAAGPFVAGDFEV
jgi:hypothetical protein